jgi:triosephosphate isomerase (TIM)
MTHRTPIIAGNWKMHKTVQESVDFVTTLSPMLAPFSNVERVVCPSFVSLASVHDALQGSDLKLGAQNVSTQEKGAYTSQISPSMLKGIAEYVIIGHSECRQYLGETDADINAKAKLLLAHGLKPIIACGESDATNTAGETDTFVSGQIRAALDGITAEQMHQIVIAYEPIWAIGTGKSASPEFAQQVVGGVIRATLTDLYGETVAQAVRIQYGGSVKPANMAQYMSQPDIDGALVGGAALDVNDFTALVEIAAQTKGA